jgi:hypothetical protein
VRSSGTALTAMSIIRRASLVSAVTLMIVSRSFFSRSAISFSAALALVLIFTARSAGLMARRRASSAA